MLHPYPHDSIFSFVQPRPHLLTPARIHKHVDKPYPKSIVRANLAMHVLIGLGGDLLNTQLRELASTVSPVMGLTSRWWQ